MTKHKLQLSKNTWYTLSQQNSPSIFHWHNFTSEFYKNQDEILLFNI